MESAIIAAEMEGYRDKGHATKSVGVCLKNFELSTENFNVLTKHLNVQTPVHETTLQIVKRANG